MSLARAQSGMTYRVKAVHPDNPVSCRLMEMGLIEGAEVQLVRRAPLGDPLQLRVGDYDLSVRASDAALIEVSGT